MPSRRIAIELGLAEAVVLFELVHTLEEDGVPFAPPEQLALWRLSGALESAMVEPLRPDYREVLAHARSLLTEQAGG